VSSSSAIPKNLNIINILGMAKMEGGVKILLDIDQVLSGSEFKFLKQAAKYQ
jgi:hypothetical protein